MDTKTSSTLLSDFQVLRNIALEESARFERELNFSMAYLTLWCVLEKTSKAMYPLAAESRLHFEIKAWESYLAKEAGEKAPTAIPASYFLFGKPQRIPEVEILEIKFGPLPKMKAIFNTVNKAGSTKWRDRRNDIAHNAATFTKASTFEEYKQKLFQGIEELDECLSKHNHT